VPEYLAPGVYVEEVSFRAPSIEGVGTTTTAFAGPTLTGPVGGMPYGGIPASGSPVAGSPSGGVPELLTSFGDFHNIYGSYDNLALKTSPASPAKNINYMAMAVKAFFDNGGSMLYVSRVFANNPPSGGANDPGIATSGGSTTTNVVVAARFPGAFLNGRAVTVTLNAARTLNASNLPSGSLLGVPGSGGGSATFYANGSTSTFMSNAATPAPLPSPLPANLYVLTLKVTAPGAAGQEMAYDNLGLDPNHPNYVGNVLGVNPPRHIDALQNQIYCQIGSGLTAPDKLFGALFPTWIDPSAPPSAWQPGNAFTLNQIILDLSGNIQSVQTAGTSGTSVPAFNKSSGQTTADGGVTWINLGPWHPVGSFSLKGGDDGAEPMAANYATALQYCEPLEDVAIVATPGASIYTDNTNIMIGSLIPHVERQRAYRVAILETGPNLIDSDYENVRARIDSSYSALYVPWIITPNPLAVSGTSIPAEIAVPPAGFMAGIYARNDTHNSVAKAPANEVVLGAIDFERHITFAEQAALNPLGINCLRFFPDRGYRVWGARTASSNSELMYINVRRYLIYLEHSIDNGTQWAVFENNGPSLWARVKDSIDSFLNNEFAEGNLLGTSPSDAYFVRCDRTTMTQNDLDNGRMICLIGVALLKPAEFVIFRIGQMTANARS
jgi:uncharacterized protein